MATMTPTPVSHDQDTLNKVWDHIATNGALLTTRYILGVYAGHGYGDGEHYSENVEVHQTRDMLVQLGLLGSKSTPSYHRNVLPLGLALLELLDTHHALVTKA